MTEQTTKNTLTVAPQGVGTARMESTARLSLPRAVDALRKAVEYALDVVDDDSLHITKAVLEPEAWVFEFRVPYGTRSDGSDYQTETITYDVTEPLLYLA